VEPCVSLGQQQKKRVSGLRVAASRQAQGVGDGAIVMIRAKGCAGKTRNNESVTYRSRETWNSTRSLRCSGCW
jgi:hypothetical protein